MIEPAFVLPSPDSYRELMGNWATGVCVVTAYERDRPAGCTISSLTSVALDPPLVLIGLTRTSRMFRILMAARTFCVNVLASNQEELCSKFATEMEHSARFIGVPTSDVARTPVIHGCLANVICTVHSESVFGDRVLVVGEPVQYMLAPERAPLVVFRRSLTTVADPLPAPPAHSQVQARQP